MVTMNFRMETIMVLTASFMELLPEAEQKVLLDMQEGIMGLLRESEAQYKEACRHLESCSSALVASREVARAAEECNEGRKEMIRLLESKVRGLQEDVSRLFKSSNHQANQTAKYQNRARTLQSQLYKMEREWLKDHQEEGMTLLTPYGAVAITKDRLMEIADSIKAGDTIWAAQIIRAYCQFTIQEAKQTMEMDPNLMDLWATRNDYKNPVD